MTMYLCLTREEIQQMIPYAIVAETMSRAIWDTGKRRRLMREQFTEAERDAVNRLHAQARNWCYVKGLPDELKLTMKTLALWHKLADFCCQL